MGPHRYSVHLRFPDQVPLKFQSRGVSVFCSQLYSSPGTRGRSFAKAKTHLDMSRWLNNPSQLRPTSLTGAFELGACLLLKLGCSEKLIDGGFGEASFQRLGVLMILRYQYGVSFWKEVGRH